MNTIETARQRAREVLAEGRKFADDDMTPELATGASDYARTYAGSFSFMLEMRTKANGRGLSTPQARGVMNCMVAEERNAAPATPLEFGGIAAMLAKAREHLKYPRIRLVADGQEFAVSLAGERSKEPGSVVVTGERDATGMRKYLGRISTDGTFRGSPPPAVMDALQAFAADPETVAQAYGRLTGACAFCGLALKDERSTAVGYGPVCAKNYGLRWGTAAAA